MVSVLVFGVVLGVDLPAVGFEVVRMEGRRAGRVI
jgi:hypothetical protein